jgi:hypothetical protein
MINKTADLLTRTDRLLSEVSALLADIRAELSEANTTPMTEAPDNNNIISDSDMRRAAVNAIKAGRMLSADIATLAARHGVKVLTEIQDPAARAAAMHAMS